MSKILDKISQSAYKYPDKPYQDWELHLWYNELNISGSNPMYCLKSEHMSSLLTFLQKKDNELKEKNKNYLKQVKSITNVFWMNAIEEINSNRHDGTSTPPVNFDNIRDKITPYFIKYDLLKDDKITNFREAYNFIQIYIEMMDELRQNNPIESFSSKYGIDPLWKGKTLQISYDGKKYSITRTE